MSWLTPDEMYAFMGQVGFGRPSARPLRAPTYQEALGMGDGFLIVQEPVARDPFTEEPDTPAQASRVIAGLRRKVEQELTNARARAGDTIAKAPARRTIMALEQQLAYLVASTSGQPPENVASQWRTEAQEMLDVIRDLD